MGLIMTKYMAIFIIFVAGLLAWDIRQNNIISISSTEAQAGIFEDISTAISGHITDFESRVNHEDEFIKGTDIGSGSFRTDDPGQDFVHNGSGDLKIVDVNGELYIQFDSNFTTSPGPDYHVYISDKLNIKDEASFNDSFQPDLGSLKAGSGAQFYKLPKWASDNDSFSITIWCKQFGEFIASANVSK